MVENTQHPVRQASEEYVSLVSRKLNQDEYQQSMAEDIQNPQLSHQEWSRASENTSLALDHKCKEPRNLLFFVGTVYQFTYNSDSNFTQSQLGLLLDLPSKIMIETFKSISIMVAPPGIK